jgi:hypothetical protein
MTSPTEGGRPRAITILFGVPLDYDAFAASVARSDWLAKFNEQFDDEASRDHALRRRWREEYQPLVADPLERVAHLAISRRLQVVTGATLDSVRALASEDIVVVFAHWKGHELIASDLHLHSGDWTPRTYAEALLDRSSRSSTAMARRLSSELRDYIARADGSRSQQSLWTRFFQPPSTKTLGEILHHAITEPDDDDPAPGDGIDEVLEHESVRLARRRDALDSLFDGLLRPGNRLELFDGLHSKQAIDDALPPEFEGILDLAGCTSIVPADYLQGRRDYKLRVISYPAVREFARIGPAVLSALSVHLEQGVPYQEARQLVTRALQALAGSR